VAKFDTQQVLQFLKVKWHGQTCPLCNSGNWTAQDSTFQLMEFNAGSLVVGGPVIPVIPITCSNCGNVVLVNAIVANAVTPAIGSATPASGSATPASGTTKP